MNTNMIKCIKFRFLFTIKHFFIIECSIKKEILIIDKSDRTAARTNYNNH